MFTDNVVAERAFFRGTSRSPTLFELIVGLTRLTRLQMSGHVFLLVIWISGKRMQSQGTDGLSRADFNTGVMAGRKMLDYVPICRTGFERSSSLQEWATLTLTRKSGFSYLPKDGSTTPTPQEITFGCLLLF
jgi:hypothetical protein